MRASLLPALLALPLLGGCTFLNLDGFDVPSCLDFGDTPREQALACANALSERDGVPAGCVPYECSQDTGQCVLLQGTSVELCDGLDNDCDAKIDETTPNGDRVLTPSYEPPALVQTTVPTEFQVATSGTQPQLTWTDSSSAAFFSTLGGATPQRFEWRRNDQVDNIAVAPTLEPSGAALNCWRRETQAAGVPLGDAEPSPSMLVPGQCNFTRVAPAIFEDTGYLAALNTVGCAQGQLRVGHTSPGDATSVLQLGPYGRSNSFAGLALGGDGRCSATDPGACDAALEARRALLARACPGTCPTGERCIGGSCQPVACDADAECGAGNECLCGLCQHPDEAAVVRACGFSDISMGATERETGEGIASQALVATVSGSLRDAAECTELVRDVAVNGLQFRRRNNIESLLATDEGQLQVIGQTRGSAAPAVLAVRRNELIAFVVAFGDEAGRMRLHAVNDDLPTVRNFPELSCEPITGSEQACIPPGDDASPQPSVCLPTACGSDEGLCESGVQRCEGNEAYCEGIVRARPEICDSGEDEDCDGLVDENPAGLPCSSAEAGCAPAGDDACDGRDDDCDGRVDEHAAAALPATCEAAGAPSADGICGGTPVCLGGEVICEGAALPRQMPAGRNREVCGNGLDDDCNPSTPDDDPDCIAETCNPALQGPGGAPEFCNGQDDDGDCAVDEAPDGLRFGIEDFIDTPSVSRPAEVIRQCLAVPPIAAEAQETFTLQGNLDLPGGVIDDVAVEVGPSTNSFIDLGIVWRERTPEGTAVIGFRRATLELSCACLAPASPTCDDGCTRPQLSIASLRDATTPQRVTAGPGTYGPPSIAFARAGFLEPQLARDGTTLATPAEGGGWFVSWLDDAVGGGTTVRVRRFAARDGLAIEPCESPETCGYEITEDPTLRGALPALPDFPVVFPDLRLGSRFAYYDAANMQIISGELQRCGGTIAAPGTEED
ncbi:MAG: MopE-related protein [Myxococcota bacterium]